MDWVSESLLNEFSNERGMRQLSEGPEPWKGFLGIATFSSIERMAATHRDNSLYKE